MKEERIKEIMSECGVGNIFLDAKLSDFASSKQAAIKNSFLLIGPVGCGKTRFLSAIIREYIEYPKERKERLLPIKYIMRKKGNSLIRKRVPPLFITVSDYLFKLRSSYEKGNVNEAEIIDNLINCPILCLDDFGTVQVTEWSIQMLDIIFNGRYNNHKKQRTYITSNWTLNELEDNFGPRITSRIMGMCQLIAFGGVDKRNPEK